MSTFHHHVTETSLISLRQRRKIELMIVMIFVKCLSLFFFTHSHTLRRLSLFICQSERSEWFCSFMMKSQHFKKCASVSCVTHCQRHLWDSDWALRSYILSLLFRLWWHMRLVVSVQLEWIIACVLLSDFKLINHAS